MHVQIRPATMIHNGNVLPPWAVGESLAGTQSTADKFSPGLKLGIEDHLPSHPKPPARRILKARPRYYFPRPMTSHLPSSSSGRNLPLPGPLCL